jgi:antitoxin VapB
VQTHKTKTFRSGNSQAVRLPKQFAYPDGTELEMVKEGGVVTLRPIKISMQQMIEELRNLPSVPLVEVRDTDIFPQRDRL